LNEKKEQEAMQQTLAHKSFQEMQEKKHANISNWKKIKQHNVREQEEKMKKADLERKERERIALKKRQSRLQKKIEDHRILEDLKRRAQDTNVDEKPKPPSAKELEKRRLKDEALLKKRRELSDRRRQEELEKSRRLDQLVKRVRKCKEFIVRTG
jgi:hypothetical protein